MSVESDRVAAQLQADLQSLDVQIENRRSLVAVESAELAADERRKEELQSLLRHIAEGNDLS
jgi:hypothetical protein